MEFPDEMNQFMAQMHVDFFREVDSRDATIWALTAIGRRRSEVVKQFLAGLLSSPCDVGELEQLWRASPADISLIDPGQIPVFFQMVRDLADSPQVKSSPVL